MEKKVKVLQNIVVRMMLKLCGFVHLFLLEIVCNFQFKNSIDVGSILPTSRMNGDTRNF
jgi:hypothetical protein